MGSGKSRTLCEEVVRQMVQYPGNRGLLIRATLADFKLSTYLTLIEEVLKPYFEYGIAKENKSEKFIDFYLEGGKSRLYYGGLDATDNTKDKYFSTQYGCIGMDEARVELLKWASPMHDIGKLGVPDAVLQKPGKLTDEEYAVMQKHNCADVLFQVYVKGGKAALKAMPKR